MNHKPHVGLVDPHAERVGGDHDPDPVKDEILLVLPPLGVLQPGVIAGGGNAALLQRPANLLDCRAGGAVDDAAAVPIPFQQTLQAGGLVPGAEDLQAEVGPVEPGGDAERVLAAPAAVSRRPGPGSGGCGREGAHGGPLRQRAEKRGDFQIAGTEVLPPLGDAVGFVHRHQGDGDAARQIQECGGLQRSAAR